jgi:two-component system LytT family response regulator
MKINALIVDDEPLALARLRKMLALEPEVEIAGECGNGAEAINFIRSHPPDLVFLDVQMPEVSGFDVLRAIPVASLPAVIFVTAHDQHAVEAFEVDALDYLLKPFTQARLKASVSRVRLHLQARDVSALNQHLAEWLHKTPPAGPAYLNRFAIKNGSQTTFIKVEDVDYVEAASNYAVLHTAGGNHVVRETLLNLEATLPPRKFRRISRSVIVNLERIREIHADARGDHLVVLQSNHQLSLTRNVHEIMSCLQFPEASGQS